jgi:hypothetical protein
LEVETRLSFPTTAPRIQPHTTGLRTLRTGAVQRTSAVTQLAFDLAFPVQQSSWRLYQLRECQTLALTSHYQLVLDSARRSIRIGLDS